MRAAQSARAAGDQLLQNVAERLKASCRAEDTIARIGGDEFAILSVGIGYPARLSLVAERIIAAFAEPFELNQPPVVIGISIGITEPEAGSAATAMKTRGEIDGNEIVLNGRKQFVSFVNYNQYTLVYCRIGSTGRASDIGAVIVPHDTPGFSHSNGTLNMADELLFELYFDDCRVPVENILIDGGAFGKLISVYNAERLGSISRMIGSAEASYEYALAYSKERRQFNREISDFQGIQWMLAEMRVKLDAAKLLTYRAAANAGAKGLPNPTEVSIAKVFVAKAAKEICDDAIQILGANGYTREYPLAHRYAEVRGGSIYGGTMQIHKNMIAAAILERKISQWKAD